MHIILLENIINIIYRQVDTLWFQVNRIKEYFNSFILTMPFMCASELTFCLHHLETSLC